MLFEGTLCSRLSKSISIFARIKLLSGYLKKKKNLMTIRGSTTNNKIVRPGNRIVPCKYAITRGFQRVKNALDDANANIK